MRFVYIVNISYPVIHTIDFVDFSVNIPPENLALAGYY